MNSLVHELSHEHRATVNFSLNWEGLTGQMVSSPNNNYSGVHVTY